MLHDRLQKRDPSVTAWCEDVMDSIKSPNASRHPLRDAIRFHAIIVAENSGIISIMKRCETTGETTGPIWWLSGGRGVRS